MFQEFACNGTVVEHPEYGEVLQLQGDQRHNICGFLTKTKLAKADQLKVHGFQNQSQNIRYGNCIDIEWITISKIEPNQALSLGKFTDLYSYFRLSTRKKQEPNTSARPLHIFIQLRMLIFSRSTTNGVGWKLLNIQPLIEYGATQYKA